MNAISSTATSAPSAALDNIAGKSQPAFQKAEESFSGLQRSELNAPYEVNLPSKKLEQSGRFPSDLHQAAIDKLCCAPCASGLPPELLNEMQKIIRPSEADHQPGAHGRPPTGIET